MATAGISIVPIGTGSTSVSRYIADSVKILQKEPGIKYEVTAMTTIIEGELDKIFEVAKKMHRSFFDAGVKRIVTSIRIDDRLDKPMTIESKVKAVKEKLNK